jgi:hypothetical protein
MEMAKTNHDQVIKLPDFVMSALRWKVDKQLVTRGTWSGANSYFPGNGRVPSQLGAREPVPVERREEPPDPGRVRA